MEGSLTGETGITDGSVAMETKQDESQQDQTQDEKDEAAKKVSEEAGKRLMESVNTQESILTGLLTHGCRLVGNVEIASMNEEISAVTKDESQETKWQTRLQQDSDNAKISLEKIEAGWKETEEMSIAENLQTALEELRQESTHLVTQKRGLIQGLKEQLTVVDEAFSGERLHQAQQRSQMLDRVTEHVLELVRAYQFSIRKLQSRANESFGDLLVYFEKEVERSVEELNANLLQMMKKKKENRLMRAEQLMALQVYGMEDDAAASNKTRMDVEKVLLELYRLNARQKVEEDQLGFNLEVLREQFKETTALVSEGRRRVNALRPVVMEHRQKWEKLEKTKTKNAIFKMEQIARKKDQLRATKSRLTQFLTQSRSRLRGISYMHYNRLQDLVLKVHELDRRIELTVLSRDIRTDEDHQLLRELHPALQPRDTPALAAAARILDTTVDKDPQMAAEVSNEEAVLEEMFLRQMTNCAEFLVDPVHGIAPEERQTLPLLFLEQIFWELGIQNERDVNKIINIAKRRFFSRHKSPPFERIAEQWQSSRDQNLVDLVFPAEDVLQTLSDFSKERGKEEQENRLRDLEDPLKDSPPFLPREDSRRWSQLVDETTKERNKSWRVIKDALQKYHSILTSRLTESLRVENLREENEEYNYLLFSITSNGEVN